VRIYRRDKGEQANTGGTDFRMGPLPQGPLGTLSEPQGALQEFPWGDRGSKGTFLEPFIPALSTKMYRKKSFYHDVLMQKISLRWCRSRMIFPDFLGDVLGLRIDLGGFPAFVRQHALHHRLF